MRARAAARRVSDILPGKMESMTTEGAKTLAIDVEENNHAVRAKCNHKGQPPRKKRLDWRAIASSWNSSRLDPAAGRYAWSGTRVPPEKALKVAVWNGEPAVMR